MPSIQTAYNWAINTCNAPNVGYSQPYRNQRTVNGITYYDCSSFIWYALKTGGFDVVAAHYGETWPMTTSEEDGFLTRLGFTRYNFASSVSKAGDVLWRSGHTEMVYEGGNGQARTMGAHGVNSYPVLADQVSINSSFSSRWTYGYRYGEGAIDGGGGTGASLYVISAILGNWVQESNINPGLWEGLTIGSPGYGLGQWTNNSQVDRRTQLFNWLQANGYAQDSPDGQLAFFIYENVWYKTGYASAYNNLTEFLNSTSTNIQDLTYAFMVGWEGIWDGTDGIRLQWANRIFNYLQTNANDTSINTWVIGNRYLTDAEILNNAVLAYRILSLGGGGGGGTITKPNTMPVWMMLRHTY